MLCWLDARSRGAAFSLRLEDVDSIRCTEASAQDMREALQECWDTMMGKGLLTEEYHDQVKRAIKQAGSALAKAKLP